ncbi:MAG: peptide chain release factor-like protein, partial [Pirellulales bacterium]|nr:peptide chain release factor-like protein [Pirellulales bacterium]
KQAEPPWYGPVCPVVWEGSGREAAPYPDWFLGRIDGLIKRRKGVSSALFRSSDKQWTLEPSMNEPAAHPATLLPEQLLTECSTRRLRRSGPGGQHRNKVETAVALRHRPTGVQAEANERRSQAANREVALFRLRVNLALEIRLERAADAAPSPLWQSRCSGGRVRVSSSHDDFPAMLAEALDVIVAQQADVKRAAAALGCTASQLTRLLKQEARAMVQVNQWRRQHGLHALR